MCSNKLSSIAFSIIESWTLVISETFDCTLNTSNGPKYTSGKRLSKAFMMIFRVLHVFYELSCTTHHLVYQEV